MMIVMEGLMLVPPDRGVLIGRALWKPRYIVLGTGAPSRSRTEVLIESSRKSSIALKALKSTSSKPSLADLAKAEPITEGFYISIYKAKGDRDLISQHPLSAFNSCEIRALTHRKHGASLPTLMMEMKPDPLSEKARKRRSSRTSGLTTKDPWANFLLFRSLPEERYNIHDWQVTMKPQLTVEGPEGSPVSPPGPFTNFVNPFASRAPGSIARPEMLNHRSDRSISTYPLAPRERDRAAMLSPSPSLRSRRSDLSSQASSQHPYSSFATQNYTTALPSDLPSPASTSGYDAPLIEGWTSAQGRSSALSSHTQPNNSIASAITPTAINGSTPPGPRETILDRAFQMRCIPGVDRVNDQDELSSIARFEALMREADELKYQKALTSGLNRRDGQDWDMDERSDEDSNYGEPLIDNDDSDGLDMSEDEADMPVPAQRALEFISGCRTPVQINSRPLSPTPRSPPAPFSNPQAMSAFHGVSQSGGLRPRTGTNASTRDCSRPSSLAVPSRSVSAAAGPSFKDVSTISASISKNSADCRDTRQSNPSIKRSSFQEFTKRLSSTSSLLLVPTSTSSSSGRDGGQRLSTEISTDYEEKGGIRGTCLSHELKDSQLRNNHCGWRGSVGLFGGDGGFL